VKKPKVGEFHTIKKLVKEQYPENFKDVLIYSTPGSFLTGYTYYKENSSSYWHGMDFCEDIKIGDMWAYLDEVEDERYKNLKFTTISSIPFDLPEFLKPCLVQTEFKTFKAKLCKSHESLYCDSIIWHGKGVGNDYVQKGDKWRYLEEEEIFDES
jgi:hypothetical protein